MILLINGHTLEIDLSPLERLWAFHLGEQIKVPLSRIQHVRLDCPQTSLWKELRAPGTHLPGMFKAGTYYTDRGREFWYVQSGQPCLCLDILDGYYKRIVLSLETAEQWASQIVDLMSIADSQSELLEKGNDTKAQAIL